MKRLGCSYLGARALDDKSSAAGKDRRVPQGRPGLPKEAPKFAQGRVQLCARALDCKGSRSGSRDPTVCRKDGPVCLRRSRDQRKGAAVRLLHQWPVKGPRGAAGAGQLPEHWSVASVVGCWLWSLAQGRLCCKGSLGCQGKITCRKGSC